MADIFVSYTSSDRDAAHWIGRELEAIGHVPHVHDWEIKGGEDIYAWMHERHDAADHVLCVVSDEYLRSPFSTLERNAALWRAASDRPGFVLLVVVKPCRLPTLSDHLKRCELYGLPEETARARLVAFMAAGSKPQATPFFGRAAAVSNVPVRVPTHFMGREESLEAIGAALGRYEGRVAITTLHGLRGVGKTTLAAAYAERNRHQYRATWWIRAQTEPTMRADLVALGVRLGWVGPDDPEDPALAAVRERLLHEGDGILLIYDNAIDAPSLSRYLPAGGAARVLVTSNAHAWRGVAEPVQIRLWPTSIGADYLIVRTGRSFERAAAEALSEALGGLPLAHEQVAAYCERLELGLAEYAQRFAAAPVQMLDKDKYTPAEYHDGLTVAKTFALAIEQAGRLHPAAAPLIQHLALLVPEPVPLFLLREGRADLGEPLASLLDDEGLDEAVGALRTFALVDRESIPDEREPDVTTDTVRLHRLVREVATAGLSPEARLQGQVGLLRALATVFPPQGYGDPSSWIKARRLDALVTGLFGAGPELADRAASQTALLLNAMGLYRDVALADYAAARLLLERALALSERVLGPEHHLTLTSINNLGCLLRVQGDLPRARLLHERDVEVRERVRGPDDPLTATALTNLATLLHGQGEMAQARALFERSLAIREKANGPDHFDTAISLHNLANLLINQGELGQARPLTERALAILEKTLGPDHPIAVNGLFLLAAILEKSGDLEAAQPLYERVLASRERVLGPHHPDTATSLNNLAIVVEARGDLEGSRALYERALAIHTKVFGPDHTRTAVARGNLALLLEVMGDLAGARPMLEWALASLETGLGSNHPNTGRWGMHLARLLLRDGEHASAASLAARSLAAQELHCGPTHAWTLDSARVTADAYQALGRHDEAAALRERFGLA